MAGDLDFRPNIPINQKAAGKSATLPENPPLICPSGKKNWVQRPLSTLTPIPLLVNALPMVELMDQLTSAAGKLFPVTKDSPHHFLYVEKKLAVYFPGGFW